MSLERRQKQRRKRDKVVQTHVFPGHREDIRTICAIVAAFVQVGVLMCYLVILKVL